jgi:hypothetical protein
VFPPHGKSIFKVGATIGRPKTNADVQCTPLPKILKERRALAVLFLCIKECSAIVLLNSLATFLFDTIGAKRKVYKRKTPLGSFVACGRRGGLRPSNPQAFKKA